MMTADRPGYHDVRYAHDPCHSMPGVVPQAKAARAEIIEFLRGALATGRVPARPAGKAAGRYTPAAAANCGSPTCHSRSGSRSSGPLTPPRPELGAALRRAPAA
ncbi:hypothetical protein [Streptosporangium roseum]|uniref:hypothetical protein n=1 Tax=Streptosporangium roseum TaxID=2001 RepID=UPI00332EB2C7